MLRPGLIISLLSIFFASCDKNKSGPPNTGGQHDSFKVYTIRAGNNYMDLNSYPVFSDSILAFVAKFDSSCIYSTSDPANQPDINKLYGTADCSSHHHKNSARFGWNWLGDGIHIFAYVYSDSIRTYRELGTTGLDMPVTCRLRAYPGFYEFELNGRKDTMQRHCSDNLMNGYRLYPYFGGDEPAPHDIRIMIRDL